MARVHPFASIRPTPERASQVAALPYDVLSAEEARMLVKDNPYSFLHVDKAEIDVPGFFSTEGTRISPYDPSVYAKARENLDNLIADGILIRDAKPCLYIYRLTVQGRSQTGLAACVEVSDYEQGLIKKHELTRSDKEQDRVDHILACSAHTGPIFLTYRTEAEPKSYIQGWTETHAPVYDFTAEDGVRHTLWIVDEDDAIDTMVQAFERIPFLYIADGHHRSAAAAVTAKRMGNEKTDADYNRFLSVIFPHDELVILDYNRVVRDLNGLEPEQFLTKLEEHFNVEESGVPVKPVETYEYGLYMRGKWRRLMYKHPAPADVVDSLAVSVLQAVVLKPFLGIENPQTDKRIDFVGGSRGTDGLVKRVDSGEMAAAFTLCPTTMPELLNVADAGLIMPPKSTWFEPKLRSGLLIHPF